MPTINKEVLIAELTETVTEVKQRDPRVIGVVLFGSRARPEWHPHAARPDSDVDLIPVCTQNDMKVGFDLKKALCSKLALHALEGHVPEIQGKIPVIAASLIDEIDKIDKAERGNIDPEELLNLQIICCLLDEHSIVLTADVEEGRRIKRFADSVDYKLVLMNLHNPQNIRVK